MGLSPIVYVTGAVLAACVALSAALADAWLRWWSTGWAPLQEELDRQRWVDQYRLGHSRIDHIYVDALRKSGASKRVIDEAEECARRNGVLDAVRRSRQMASPALTPGRREHKDGVR